MRLIKLHFFVLYFFSLGSVGLAMQANQVWDTTVYYMDTLELDVQIKRQNIFNFKYINPQPEVLYPNGAVKVYKSKFSVFQFEGLSAGDSMVVEVSALDGKKFKEVYICNNHNRQLVGDAVSEQFNSSLVLEQDGFLGLHVRAKWSLHKKYAKVSVVKYPPQHIDTIYNLIDSVYVTGISGKLISDDSTLYNIAKFVLGAIADPRIAHDATSVIQIQSSEDTLNRSFVLKRNKILRSLTTRPTPVVLYPNGAVKVKKLKNITFKFDSISAGDTIYVTVNAKDGKEFKEIYICSNHQGQKVGGALSPEFEGSIVMKENGFLGLHIRSKWAFHKKYADLEVIRHPREKVDSFYNVLDSIIITGAIKKKIIDDSLFYSLTDQSHIISAIRDIEHETRAIAEMDVPENLNEHYYLYKMGLWIGIGQEDIDSYIALEEKPPPEWTEPGTSPPLTAYLLDYIFELPGQIQKDVGIFVLDSNQINKFWRKDYRGIEENDHFNCGKLPYLVVKKYDNTDLRGRPVKRDKSSVPLRFYLGFRNENQVIRTPIRILAIGLYKYEKYKYFPTTSTKEIIVK